ncbi:hypothetical protein D3C78_1659070 [compost metagenome]
MAEASVTTRAAAVTTAVGILVSTEATAAEPKSTPMKEVQRPHFRKNAARRM